MISESKILAAVHKHNLTPVVPHTPPRNVFNQVVKEMFEQGVMISDIATELGVEWKTVRAVLKTALLPPGTHVEFNDFEDETKILHGVVLNYLPPEGDFVGGYHIACYYVVDVSDVRKSAVHEAKSTGPIPLRLV